MLAQDRCRTTRIFPRMARAYVPLTTPPAVLDSPSPAHGMCDHVCAAFCQGDESKAQQETTHAEQASFHLTSPPFQERLRPPSQPTRAPLSVYHSLKTHLVRQLACRSLLLADRRNAALQRAWATGSADGAGHASNDAEERRGAEWAVCFCPWRPWSIAPCLRSTLVAPAPYSLNGAHEEADLIQSSAVWGSCGARQEPSLARNPLMAPRRPSGASERRSGRAPPPHTPPARLL